MYQNSKGVWFYENYCTCGGHNRTDHKSNPHLHYCPQRKEYDEWLEIMEKKDKKSG
jgi:hypothetical protein